MLFADLVGFTARSERMDPEDVQRLLQPYHAHLRSVLERHGGTVAKFVGDAVMAIFGAPVSHEDDPERAVRAALAIREELAAEGDLEVHVGITTGEALITLDARIEQGRAHRLRRQRQHRGPAGVGRTARQHLRRRGDPPGDRAVDRVQGRASRGGQRQERPDPRVGRGPTQHGGARPAGQRHTARGSRAGAHVAPGDIRPGPARARAAAPHPHRGPRDRQDAAGLGARPRARPPWRLALAGGPFPAVRRGSHVLGVLRDRARVHGRGRLGRRRAGDGQGPRRRRGGGPGAVGGRLARTAPAAAGRHRHRRPRLRRPAGRGLRRLAAAPGDAGRGTTARPRLRRPALGRRRTARLRRPRRRLGQRRPDPRARDGPPRSPRPSAQLGRRARETPPRSGSHRCPRRRRPGSSGRCSLDRPHPRECRPTSSSARAATPSTRRSSLAWCWTDAATEGSPGRCRA